MSDGMQLSMSGKGNAPKRGGVPGDLLIVIEEQEDAELKREGLKRDLRSVRELCRRGLGYFAGSAYH